LDIFNIKSAFTLRCIMRIPKKRLALSLLTALLLLLPGQVGIAKGESTKVSISGPTHYGEIQVADPLNASALGLGRLENLEEPILSPEGLGYGYLLTRYVGGGDDPQPFDRVLYFPGSSGKPGAVYYLEILNGAGPYDGKWFSATEVGDRTFRQIMAKQGVDNVEGPSVETQAERSIFPLWMLGGAAGLIVGWIVGRRVNFRSPM
jgi:hypothetical protein